MEVVFASFIDFGGSTGDSVHWRSLTRALARRGHTIVAIGKGSVPDLEFLSLDASEGTADRPVGKSVLFLRMILALSRLRESSDWLVVRDPLTALAAKVVCRRRKLAFQVNSLPDLYSPGGRLSDQVNQIVWRLYWKTLAKRVRLHICVSEGLYRSLIDDHGVGADKVQLVPLGIDASTYVPGGHASSGASIATRARFGGEATVFGYAGSLTPEKPLAKLVDAFSLALKTIPASALVFVGDGPSLNTLVSQVNRLELGSRVLFTGRLEERQAADYMSTFSCCVCLDNATGWKGSPPPFTTSKLLAYLACGRPVVTDIRLESDIARVGSQAIIASGSTAPELAEALVRGHEFVKACQTPLRTVAASIAELRSWDCVAGRLEDALMQSESRTNLDPCK